MGIGYMDEQRSARARELGLDDGQIDGLDKLMEDFLHGGRGQQSSPLGGTGIPSLTDSTSPSGMPSPSGLDKLMGDPPPPERLRPPRPSYKGRAPAPPPLPKEGGKQPEDFLHGRGQEGGQSGQGIPSILREQYGVAEETPNRADPGAAPTGTPEQGAGAGGGETAATRFVQPPQAKQQPTAAPQSDPMGGVKVAQAVAAPVMSALGNQAATAQAGVDAQQSTYDAIAERTRQQAVEQRVMRVTMEAQEQERRRAQEQVMGEYKAAEEERKAFKFKKPWADRGMGNKILAVLAAAIGGYGAGFGGGPNQALQILQQSFDQDIELQKEKYAQLGDSAQSKLTTLGHMRSRFADERQAEAATRLAMLEETQTELQALTVNLKSAEQKQAAANLGAQLEVDKAKWQAQLYMPTVEAMAKQAAQPAFDPENVHTWPEKKAALAVFGPNGKPIGIANNADNAKKSTETIKNAGELKADLRMLMQMQEESGYEAWGSDERARAEVVLNRFQGRMKKFQELGANLTKNEEKFMLLTDNPLAAFRQDRARQGMEEILRGIEREENAIMASAGIQQAQDYQPSTFQPDED